MLTTGDSARAGYRQAFDELRLTRSLLLESGDGTDPLRGGGLKNLRRFRCVTHWEELLCVAINTRLACLMAVVSIRQPDGYSSVIEDDASKEFVRFFIDWGRGDGYRPVGLHSFEVSDRTPGDAPGRLPHHQLVTAGFDAERYRRAVRDGIQPKVCAVLSWHREPPPECGYEPVFGNRIVSRIRTESIRDVLALY